MFLLAAILYWDGRVRPPRILRLRLLFVDAEVGPILLRRDERRDLIPERAHLLRAIDVLGLEGLQSELHLLVLEFLRDGHRSTVEKLREEQT